MDLMQRMTMPEYLCLNITPGPAYVRDGCVLNRHSGYLGACPLLARVLVV